MHLHISISGNGGQFVNGVVDSCSLSSWHATNGFTRESVALGACELALQVSESSDDVRCLESSVAATDGHLLQDASLDEA